MERDPAQLIDRVNMALNPGQEAIWSETLQAGVDRIHDAVELALRETCGEDLRLRRTGFFNHSFIHDFVAGWPTTDGVDERDIVLRFNACHDLMPKYTLDLFSSSAPVIIGLSNSVGDPRPDFDPSHIGDCKIVPLISLAHLWARPDRDTARRLLLEGRGFLDVAAARG